MRKTSIHKLSILGVLLLVGVSGVSAQNSTQNISEDSEKTSIAISPATLNPNAPKNINIVSNSGSSTTVNNALSTIEQANIDKRIKAEIVNALSIESGSSSKNQRKALEEKSNPNHSKPKADTGSLLVKPTQTSINASKQKEEVASSLDINANVNKEKTPAEVSVPPESNQQDTFVEKTTQLDVKAKKPISSKKRSMKSRKEKAEAETEAIEKNEKTKKTEKSVSEVDWGSTNEMLVEEGRRNPPGVKTLSFTNNERVSVALSNKDINRIFVKGDKIQLINGPSGLYTAKNDQSGAVYVNTYGESPFTLFISTLKGYNLSLLVSPGQSSGKTIILASVSQPETHWEETDNYQKTIVTLVSHMINGGETDDYDYREVKKSKVKNFYNLLEVKTIAIYDGSYLYGTISEIKNKTNKPITLKPSYFYEPGVRSVALLNQIIQPKATIFMYRVIGK